MSLRSPEAESVALKPDVEMVQLLPDGAVSIEVQNGDLVLRASQKLQQRFEVLLDRQKNGTLSAEEEREYGAICALDDALSWLNRMARSSSAKV